MIFSYTLPFVVAMDSLDSEGYAVTNAGQAEMIIEEREVSGAGFEALVCRERVRGSVSPLKAKAGLSIDPKYYTGNRHYIRKQNWKRTPGGGPKR